MPYLTGDPVERGLEPERVGPLAPAELILGLDLSLVGRVREEVVDVVGVILLVPVVVVVGLTGKDHVVPRERHLGLVAVQTVAAGIRGGSLKKQETIYLLVS